MQIRDTSPFAPVLKIATPTLDLFGGTITLGKIYLPADSPTCALFLHVALSGRGQADLCAFQKGDVTDLQDHCDAKLKNRCEQLVTELR